MDRLPRRRCERDRVSALEPRSFGVCPRCRKFYSGPTAELPHRSPARGNVSGDPEHRRRKIRRLQHGQRRLSRGHPGFLSRTPREPEPALASFGGPHPKTAVAKWGGSLDPRGTARSRCVIRNSRKRAAQNATLVFCVETMPARVSDTFVLRTYPYKEADLIVSFFTRDQGKLRGVARRARQPKSPFGAGLERLSRVHMAYFERENRDLVNMSGCELIESPFAMQSDYARGV